MTAPPVKIGNFMLSHWDYDCASTPGGLSSTNNEPWKYQDPGKYYLRTSMNEPCSTYIDDFEYEYVTCGSVIKLLNTRHNVRLHSHDIKYGSGSGQQSVTAVGDTTDKNSYWQVRGKQDTQCSRGSPVKCGSTIRLMHVATRRNLHSHLFQSPLSHNQEVSCFGEDGEGDTGDNWVVVCSTQLWRRNEGVRLKHVGTEKFLTVMGDVYGRPIHGQKEVCAHSTASQNNNWKSMEGIYVKPIEETK